jgi:hypothetical protein
MPLPVAASSVTSATARRSDCRQQDRSQGAQIVLTTPLDGGVYQFNKTTLAFGCIDGGSGATCTGTVAMARPIDVFDRHEDFIIASDAVGNIITTVSYTSAPSESSRSEKTEPATFFVNQKCAGSVLFIAWMLPSWSTPPAVATTLPFGAGPCLRTCAAAPGLAAVAGVDLEAITLHAVQDPVQMKTPCRRHRASWGPAYSRRVRSAWRMSAAR